MNFKSIIYKMKRIALLTLSFLLFIIFYACEKENPPIKEVVISASEIKCDLRSIYFINTEIGYAVGLNASIYKTIDGGTMWSVFASGTSQWLNSICFTDADTGYAVGGDGTIIKTINGGSSWSTLSSGINEYNLNSVFFTGAKTGYIVGDAGTILRTTNSGSTWEPLTGGPPYAIKSIHFTNANNGYVVGWNGAMAKTSNGGTTWTVINVTNTWLESVYFNDSNTGFAVPNFS